MLFSPSVALVTSSITPNCFGACLVLVYSSFSWFPGLALIKSLFLVYSGSIALFALVLYWFSLGLILYLCCNEPQIKTYKDMRNESHLVHIFFGVNQSMFGKGALADCTNFPPFRNKARLHASNVFSTGGEQATS